MYNEIISTLEEKLQKTIGVFKSEINTVRAGRANPALLDGIKIDYYGQQTPLVQVASISVPEARLLVIQPWDASVIELIEKEILKSNLGDRRGRPLPKDGKCRQEQTEGGNAE